MHRMWSCLGLSICTLIVLLVFTTVEGGTDFPQKCLDQFRISYSSFSVICINGKFLTNVAIHNLTCQAGELFYIDNFVLHLSTLQDGQCHSLDGFHYNQTINASCLNREYKDESKKIALVLMSSYKNISEVQSSLNRIVPGMYMLSVGFHCRPVKNNFIDICNKSSQEGWLKGIIKLDTKALKEIEKPPSYCSCSVISFENRTKVSAVDVRLSSATFKSYQDIDDSGSDVFPKDSFLWNINGQQEINSNFFNLTLSLEKETPDSLWIEIEGSNMNISCSPIVVNGTGLPQPQKPNTAGHEIEIIVGAAIGGFVVLVGLIFLIVFLCTRRRSRTQQDILTKSAQSASFSEIKEAIYAEPDTPEAETKTPLVSSNYMELEKNNIYAEPGPANNNFKSVPLPSPPYKDEESENLVSNNIYNHLGEQSAPSQIHIYNTTGSHEYSTTFDRKNNSKVINNIYDRQKVA